MKEDIGDVIQPFKGPNLKDSYLKRDLEYSCRILHGSMTVFTKMHSRNPLTLWIGYNQSNITTKSEIKSC